MEPANKNQTGPPIHSDPEARFAEILTRIRELRAEFESPGFNPRAKDYRETFSRFNAEIADICEATQEFQRMYTPLLAEMYSELVQCIGALSFRMEQAGPDRTAMNTVEDFARIPNGPALDIFGRAFSAADIDAFTRSKALDNVETKDNGSVLEISRGTDDYSVSLKIELKGFSHILSRQNQTDKVFMFLLTEINRQCVHSGEVTGFKVMINLDDMVSSGLYTNRNNAKRAFISAFEDIMSMQIRGECSFKKGKTSRTYSSWSVPFTDFKFDNDVRSRVVIVEINRNVDWTLFTYAFTIIPKYYYSLKKRARMLLLYLCHLARNGNNLKKIENGEPFKVGFLSVGDFLGLPDPGGREHPYRDTIGAIEEAVTEIEGKNGTHGLRITPMFERGAPVSRQWSKGFLEVLFFGDFAEPFKAYAPRREKQIAESMKQTRATKRRKRTRATKENQSPDTAETAGTGQA